ncbi:sporulation protein [Streptosporangium nondiastaticum]|uniref:Sporulation protein n=1 Tax=Streptosporangium nondiastaticum TaxID=35764 RepID=A0A9X7PEI3_9ACTN|nr:MULTISPECIES: sporulation protein [Actinomycetes]PSJ25030.1 sporulation protein [Streptosporangium nondiastaticum]WKU44221.1 sporulation protein [Streptomyces sp. VNUA116]
MGFKKLLASLGAGGASVETVLFEENVVPGGIVQGEVRIQGGSVAQAIQGLSVGLQARVEVEGDDSEYKQDVEFTRVQLGGAFEVQAGAVHTVPFGLEVPWETPVTTFLGRHLTGMNVGVTTHLAIARAVDSGDLDPVNVHPLPAQQAILDAFGQLGFAFKSADLERGHIRGTRQRLPFYQEIEFRAPSQYRGLNEVELSFVADDREMDVVLEMDKKPGLFTEGSDTYRSFTVDLHAYGQTDWAAYLNQWLAEVGGRRNWF